MFLDEKNEWDPPEPSRVPIAMSRTDRVILWILGFNILALAFAPMVWTLFGDKMKALFSGFAG